jgi:hypothetical protein
MVAGMSDGLFAGKRLEKTRVRVEALIDDLYGRTRSRKLARDRREALAMAEADAAVGEPAL